MPEEMDFLEDLIVDPNSYVVRRNVSDGEKRYVSDVIDMRELVEGKLNLIYAPTGSGKTTFIESALKWYATKQFSQKLLYLVPTRSLADAAKHRGSRVTKRLADGTVVEWWEQGGMVIMTYAGFGTAIQRERQNGRYQAERWWGNDALICLDELSQAVHQAYYSSNNPTMFALQELVNRCKDKSNLIVTLSATPKPALNYFYFWNDVDINIVKSTLSLEGYKTNVIDEYYDLNNLLMSIDADKRGLIYIGKIEQISQAVSLLEGRGIHAVGIWSDNNINHRLNKEQLKTVETLVSQESIPEDIQVLIINTAYETGLNIRPEKSHLDYIVVHNSNEDTITQVRGRYRGDLDTLYKRVKPNDAEGFVRPVDHEIIRPFLGVRLGKSDKKKLIESLNFRDDRGRLIGWTKVAEHIRANGYLVTERKSGGKRYWVILRGADQ